MQDQAVGQVKLDAGLAVAGEEDFAGDFDERLEFDLRVAEVAEQFAQRVVLAQQRLQVQGGVEGVYGPVDLCQVELPFERDGVVDELGEPGNRQVFRAQQVGSGQRQARQVDQLSQADGFKASQCCGQRGAFLQQLQHLQR